jgi:hypothetical protein
MALDTGLAFEFMRINYKYGLLDEVGSIIGEALEEVMLEQGMDMEDIFNILDGTSEATVAKVNRLLDRYGTLVLRLAANDTMTRLQAYLLKRPAVRRTVVRIAKSQLRKRLVPGGGAPSSGLEGVGL